MTDCSRTVAHPELVIKVVEVFADRSRREIENGGDLAVRLSSRNPEKNLALAGCECRERPGVPSTRGRVVPELDKVRLEEVENELVSFAEVPLEAVEPEPACYPVGRREPELELVLALKGATNLPVQVESTTRAVRAGQTSAAAGLPRGSTADMDTDRRAGRALPGWRA